MRSIVGSKGKQREANGFVFPLLKDEPAVLSVLLILLAMGVVVAGCGSDDSTSSVPSKDAGRDTATDVKPDTNVTDSAQDTVTEETGPTECEPKTCAQLEANCGSAPDGCGEKIECGECPDGQLCGGGGPNVCGTEACYPKSCVQVGAQCGWASDGCSLAIDCGECSPPETCGGGGEMNVCGCSPKTCSQLGANCGTLPDGCLGTLNCGSCSGGQVCGGAGPNLCGSSECMPKTCSQLGVGCGIVSDGCSEALDCGSCESPEVCGGGGIANQCGCTPKSCSQLGASCGEVETGCGKTDCGSCVAPDTCGGGGQPNQCGCQCSLPHATTHCQGGTCSIKNCDPGWGNCDSIVDNGCELDTTSHADNCGSCGLSCSFANASASCVNSKCVMGKCDEGFADCDGNVDNGCEANLMADPSNCKTCGKECPANGGTPVCVKGVCDVSNCNPGLADCDPSKPGCETNTTNNPEHCGFCNNACKFANGTGKCVNSTCQLDACDAGWGNCDGNASNGCETNTNTAVNHCGDCGNTCPSRPHAKATCNNGSCGFVCDPGWENCDGSATNGCEVNTQSSVNHCGACGKACNLPHATAACSNGSCTISSCDSGWGDCNGNPTDGCEVNLNTSPNYCGSCGNKCSVTNGTAGCSNGKCTIASCNAGYVDCDGAVTTGCEINTTNDVFNCGSCGVACNSTNGTAMCQSSKCVIACYPGYGNCNGLVEDGCETNTQSSPNHCGGCGQTCSNNHISNPTCTNGVCSGACTTGWADCDSNKLTNGCETNTNTSVDNCGGCGNACSGNNIPSRSCANGVCNGSCASGYADCNGNKLTDGCETNTASDVSHCGACNKPCSTNHVSPLCSNGQCIGKCQIGYSDCNNNKQTDGCEVNTAADILNCGTCGNSCTNPTPPQVSTVGCLSGSCTVTKCDDTYYDQNQTFGDGCECQADTIANSCSSASTISTLYTATITMPSTSTYYNIVPTGDEDWFTGAIYDYGIYYSGCNYRPKIELIDPSNLLLMNVYNASSCSSSTGYACSTAEGGTSTKGVRTWEFGHSATCGDYQAIDPTPATGTYMQQSTSYRIRVYANASSSSCLPYQIRLSRY
ncbi:MAG TPA: hypothetical protein PK140_15495 [Polyangiaceae bacterium]|nr:hypothetical protein [Polyangiaceae bacterium]